MTKTELSVFMFGLYYIFSIGLPFLFFPHYALGLFGLVAGGELWVRVLGLIIAIMGAYYVAAVRGGVRAFYPWTVPSRYATGALQAVMVGLGLAGPALLMFAAFDTATASLTWLALRAEKDGEEAANAA